MGEHRSYCLLAAHKSPVPFRGIRERPRGSKRKESAVEASRRSWSTLMNAFVGLIEH